MRSLGVSLLIGLMAIVFVAGFGGPPKVEKPEVVEEMEAIVIDDFEDGDYTDNPEWWEFDDILLRVVSNEDLTQGEELALGEYSLSMKGEASNWYVGGCGCYLARDAGECSSVEMNIYGQGRKSGTLKIELYEDDNGNYKIEQDEKYNPTQDDKWVYEIKVTWKGWRHVSVPFGKFKDVNPGVGDDIFNPSQEEGSGGLLHFQLITIATSKTGKINFNLDNIRIL